MGTINYYQKQIQTSDLPFNLILLLALFSALRPDRLLPWGQIFTHVPTLILGILFLIWIRSDRKVFSNKQTKYYLVFMLFILISIPFSRNWFYAHLLVKSHFIFGITTYLFTIAFLDKFSKVDTYIKVTLFGTLFFAFIGIAGGGKVITPSLGDENDFCLMMNVMIPFAYFLGQGSENPHMKIIYYGSTGLFIAANVASLSRGGFVGLIAVLVYCWLNSSRKLLGTFLVITNVASMAYFAPESYWQEMSTINQEDPTAVSRKYFWRIAWREFVDHPVMGVGPNNFGIEFPSYVRHDDSNRFYADDPTRAWGMVAHSLYFTLLSEYGIIGIFLFMNILIANLKDHKFLVKLEKSKGELLKNVKKEKREAVSKNIRKASFLSKALLGGLIAYLATGIFISVLWYSYFWSLTCLWVILCNSIRKMTDDIMPGFVTQTGSLHPTPQLP